MPKIKNTPNREHNLQALEKMPEVCVFMACYYGVRQINRLAAQEPAPKEQLEEFLQMFGDTASATYRFGVLCPIMIGHKGERDYSPFFWRWFNWWFDWLILKHTPSQLEHLRRLADNRSPELEEWRPPGDWLQHRKDLAF